MTSVGDASPWLDLAMAELGTREAPGPANSPIVVAYYRDAGHPEVASDDVAWCAAFTGAMLARAGLPVPARDVSLLARSYLTYGVACEPQPGAIAVWPRGAAWQGHVGIIVAVDRARGIVRRISGNLHDQVAIDEVPIDSELAYRWPVAATVGDLRRAGSTEVRTADKVEAAGVMGTAGAVGTVAVIEATKAPETTTVAISPPPIIDPGELKLLDQATAAVKAIGGLITAHPWLGGCVVACLLLLWLGRTLKRQRVAKAAAGMPLSVEVMP